jgi:hypothetical protein
LFATNKVIEALSPAVLYDDDGYYRMWTIDKDSAENIVWMQQSSIPTGFDYTDLKPCTLNNIPANWYVWQFNIAKAGGLYVMVATMRSGNDYKNWLAKSYNGLNWTFSDSAKLLTEGSGISNAFDESFVYTGDIVPRITPGGYVFDYWYTGKAVAGIPYNIGYTTIEFPPIWIVSNDTLFLEDNKISLNTLIVSGDITVPANSISDEELNEGATFNWTGSHTFWNSLYLDDGVGDAPFLYIQDGDDKFVIVSKYTEGHAVIYNNEGALRFHTSDDADDYIYFDTSVANVPMISTGGACDLVINASSGEISFGDENLTTTGTLDAGATSVTGNIAVTGTVDTVDVAALGATVPLITDDTAHFKEAYDSSQHDFLRTSENSDWNWADSAGEPPYWVDSSKHADSANHADDADSASKVDTTAYTNLWVHETGDTMSGVLNMGANKIQNLAGPSANSDAATKLYVDNTAAEPTVNNDITIHGQINQWNVLNRLDTSFIVASYPNTYLRLPQFYSGWSTADSAKCVNCDSSHAFHPAFVYIPEGLFSDAHHRNSRWLGYGPLCISAKDENPHIAVRDENEYWHEYFVGPESTWCVTAAGDSIPIGYYDSTLHNPVYDINDSFYFSGDAWSGTPDTFTFAGDDHASDQDLTVDYDGRMWFPFRVSWDIAGIDSHGVVIGYTDDGLNWSAGEVILSDALCKARGDSAPHNSADYWRFMSPSILPDTGQTFEMWTVEYTGEASSADIYVAKWQAPKADSGWRFVDTVRWAPSSGSKHPWHISMFRRGYDEIWCLFSESDSTKQGDSAVLMLAVSYDDGLSFATVPDTVLGLGDSSWNSRLGPYRCDCAKVNTEGTDYYELYCSSKGAGHGEALWVSKLYFNTPVTLSTLIDTAAAVRDDIRDTVGVITDLDSGNVGANALSLPSDIATFTKAELEARTTGIDAFADSTGQYWMGIHNFGEATVFELPNSNNPTVNAEGRIGWESDDHCLRVNDGSATRSIPSTKFFSATLYNPELIQDTLDDITILPVEAIWAPFGIKLLQLSIKTANSSSYSLEYQEWTHPCIDSGSQTTLEVVATSSTCEADSTNLIDSDVAAGSIIKADLPTTDIYELVVWGAYYIKTGD